MVDEYSSRFGIPTEENVFILTDIGKHLYDAIVCDAIQRSITTARSTYIPLSEAREFSTKYFTEYDSEGIICLQTFLALNLEIRQPAIPWPGPDLITSSWIFSHETYVDWLGHPQPAILCLYGKPGSGKSVLSSLVIRNLRLSSAERKRAIVFFFCDEQGERLHSTRDLLSSLIHQLLVQQPSLFRHVQSLWALKRDKSNWTRPELQVLFRAIIYSREEVEIVCIIDGLDRCDPSHLQLWEDLVDTTIIHEVPDIVATLLDDLEDSDDDTEGSDDNPPNDSEEEDIPIPAITQTSLKFLITTRRPLETHPPRGCCFSIDIEIQGGVRDDMVRLLATGVKDLVQKRPGFSGFEEIISTKLLSTPDATLLTASLCLDELETIVVSSAPASIQKMLNSISFTRDGIYARHLQSISPDWHEWAHDVLFWVLYAVRPLTVHELALALAIKQDDKSLAAIVGNISQDLAGDIERVFRGLIIIKHGEVRLSHPTIKEFILCGFMVQKYWYQIYSCNPHCRIARTCLTYLSMEDFAHVSSLAEIDGSPPLPEPQWGFLTYAAQHWHEHYRLVGEEESGMLFDVLNFLTAQVEAKGLHRAILGSDLSVQWDSKLHIAAGLGLREVVLELLGKTPSEEQVTKVLEWAARNGHDILVNQLLTDPEYLVAIGQDSSALRSATQNGHESTVKTLLQYEAKTDSPSASGNGALPLAARGGHTEVVKMLLALSVDLASRSTAFHQAVSGGHESVVKLLLDTEGINLEEKCTESELPPLHVAARGGYVGVVRQLLAHGASARSTSHQELTPLHLAAQGGHLNIVNQLLKAHATIDALDEIKFTPLHHACKQGHAVVVGYLLNAEADGNLTARFKKTPLQTAAQYGHTKVIARLLDAGVEVNTKSKDGWTALHVGVRDGRVDAVELLLKAGADIDAETRKGSTALFLAAGLGNVGITKLLLDNGANPRQTNKTQSTPLHRASQKGKLDVVELLLAADASPLVENDNGDMPLAVAEIEGHTTILAELDVDRQDKDGRTRLFHACSKEAVKDIQELLEAKADPNIRDNDGRLPLDVLLSPRGRLLFLKSIKGGAGVAKIQTLDGHPPCTRVQRKIKEWLVCDICRKDIFEEVTVFYYRESPILFISKPYMWGRN